MRVLEGEFREGDVAVVDLRNSGLVIEKATAAVTP